MTQEPVKAQFKKKTSTTKIHESHGYYISEEDFNNRNCSLEFVKLTKKTKPIPTKRKTKD